MVQPLFENVHDPFLVSRGPADPETTDAPVTLDALIMSGRAPPEMTMSELVPVALGLKVGVLETQCLPTEVAS